MLLSPTCSPSITVRLAHLQLARGCVTKPVRETAKCASDTLLFLTLLVYILRSACTRRGGASRSANTSAQNVATVRQLTFHLKMILSREKSQTNVVKERRSEQAHVQPS
ncbi:uncharacterized protein CC84DRAFT_587437 [Paraphaeosphaeria sporulosa]|uniref:Uncharacterized protein n=1 Tax=Paraphaeosphaeria sporulosa TaxID=1460663 RepID=A0A177CPH6_9PLEO|nr:uncharacterized protein CC84DRAFT_587437 [Paraphaeosphaeria sporulosa]OAG08790.1 hypothetical protein CC84DRAFT_587437 [Paraphaeosphaeria sporulosa]